MNFKKIPLLHKETSNSYYILSALIERNGHVFGWLEINHFRICTCNHVDFIHGIKCFACKSCNGFVEKEYVIFENLYEEDLFEFDTKTDLERESFAYLNELSTWRRKNALN